jgi:hypothetical protein
LPPDHRWSRFLTQEAAMALIVHVSVVVGLILSLILGPAVADPDAWKYAWPDTDFTKLSVTFKSIM